MRFGPGATGAVCSSGSATSCRLTERPAGAVSPLPPHPPIPSSCEGSSTALESDSTLVEAGPDPTPQPILGVHRARHPARRDPGVLPAPLGRSALPLRAEPLAE